MIGAIIGSVVIVYEENISLNIYEVLTVLFASLTSAFLFTIMMVFFGRQIFKLEYSELSNLRQIIISISSYFGSNFSYAKLINCDFYKSDLKNTKFYKANFNKTSVKGTLNLQLSNLSGTILNCKAVRDVLVSGLGSYLDLSYQDLSLANLNGYTLKNINFEGAKLNGATLIEADLSDSNLKQIHAIQTNFTSANMTGVCIDNWNVDSSTILQDTKANYIYIKEGERRPLSGEYEDGDFEKLFKEIDNTIDFLFKNGIDWVAFLETYKQLKVFSDNSRYTLPFLDNGSKVLVNELAVKKIESIGGNVFVVRVSVPENYNKKLFYKEFSNEYKYKERLLAQKFKQQLRIKDEQLSSIKKQYTNLESIIKVLESKSLTVYGDLKMVDKSSKIGKIEISGTQNTVITGSKNLLNNNVDTLILEGNNQVILKRINDFLEILKDTTELEEKEKEDVIRKLTELSQDIITENLTDINKSKYKSFFEKTLNYLTDGSTIANNLLEITANIIKFSP